MRAGLLQRQTAAAVGQRLLARARFSFAHAASLIGPPVQSNDFAADIDALLIAFANIVLLAPDLCEQVLGDRDDRLPGELVVDDAQISSRRLRRR